jgi:hypothetical protein
MSKSTKPSTKNTNLTPGEIARFNALPSVAKIELRAQLIRVEHMAKYRAQLASDLVHTARHEVIYAVAVLRELEPDGALAFLPTSELKLIQGAAE